MYVPVDARLKAVVEAIVKELDNLVSSETLAKKTLEIFQDVLKVQKLEIADPKRGPSIKTHQYALGSVEFRIQASAVLVCKPESCRDPVQRVVEKHQVVSKEDAYYREVVIKTDSRHFKLS